MSKDVMRNQDKGFIKFRFMYRPEYLKVGTTILFREGRTKGLGVVSRVFEQGAPLGEEGFREVITDSEETKEGTKK